MISSYLTELDKYHELAKEYQKARETYETGEIDLEELQECILRLREQERVIEVLRKLDN